MAESDVRFPLSGHVRLRIGNRSGGVIVRAEQRSDLLFERGVKDASKVEVESDGHLKVGGANHGTSTVEVRVPLGTDLVIGTASGSVDVQGRVGAAVISSASGSIKVEEALTADLRSMAGDVEVGLTPGRCCLRSASGSVRAGPTGQAEYSTVSGRIEAGPAGGDMKARSVSGNVQLATGGAHDVLVQTVSGSVTVRVPKGVHPAARIRTRSGKTSVGVEEGTDCEVVVQSLSGKVALEPV